MSVCTQCAQPFSGEKFCSNCGQKASKVATIDPTVSPKTDFSIQCEILAEFYVEHRTNEEFEDFFEYSDLGLPLAFGFANGMAEPTSIGELMVHETWNLFISSLEIEDTGFKTLDEVISLANVVKKVHGDSDVYAEGSQKENKNLFSIDFDAANLNQDEIEDHLVSIAEQPDRGSPSYSATNTLVFDILIPQRRFSEGRVWCKELIARNVGYESWNARSNLGIIEYKAGNTDLARALFEEILEAKQGPLDEAREFLQLIESGQHQPMDLRASWNYSEDWKSIPNGTLLDIQNTSDYQKYLWFVHRFADQSIEADRLEMYKTTPAACVYGAIVGTANGLSSQGVQVEREVIARSCSDFYEFVLVPQISPGGAYLVSSNDPVDFVPSFCAYCGDELTPESAGFCFKCGRARL
jgi:hypothetical protein